MRVYQEPAFVLHLRPYRETSALIDLFTLNKGRIHVVARGIRRPKSGKLLQPFTQLQVSYSGRSQLKTLIGTDVIEHHWLRGNGLYSGMYLNELLIRMVGVEDPHPLLYRGYQHTVDALALGEDVEPLLRRFELLLLQEAGYAISLEVDGQSGENICSDHYYRYEAETGFIRTRYVSNETGSRSHIFCGRHLLAIHREDFSESETRRCAKQLLRDALKPHIGNSPLQSRSLFLAGVNRGVRNQEANKNES